MELVAKLHSRSEFPTDGPLAMIPGEDQTGDQITERCVQSIFVAFLNIQCQWFDRDFETDGMQRIVRRMVNVLSRTLELCEMFDLAEIMPRFVDQKETAVSMLKQERDEGTDEEESDAEESDAEESDGNEGNKENDETEYSIAALD